MLGAYHLPGVPRAQAGDHPAMARLRKAWKAWEYRTHPAGGTLLVPKGTNARLETCAPAIDCTDGLRWHAPLALPTLHDLARDDMPQPTARIELRRCGTLSIPLGVGPVYGVGPRRGQPSSPYGWLAADLYRRSIDKEHVWTDADDDDVHALVFLALQAGYNLTEELFQELAPYDADELEPLLAAIWGRDPKASASDGRTSPPSPQESSATPG